MESFFYEKFVKKDGHHDFTLISDTINKYFPVKGPRLNTENYSAAPTVQKRGELFRAESAVYREKWGALLKRLRTKFNGPVTGFPGLTNVAFRAQVTISKFEQPDFIRESKLWFCVSFLGPFFTIYGEDDAAALLKRESIYGEEPDVSNYHAILVQTLSPIFEYEAAFKELEAELRSSFPGYLFVPGRVGMSIVKNISFAGEFVNRKFPDTVYEGLFGFFPTECETRGDENYGMSDWISPLSKKEKSLQDLINQHAERIASGITIHKVWKLRDWKQLDKVTMVGNTMFGVDLFDVFDLTDKTKMIIVPSQEEAQPVSLPYKAINDVIEFTEGLSLKIIDVAESKLIIHVMVDMKHESVSLNGAIAEMIFEPLKSDQSKP